MPPHDIPAVRSVIVGTHRPEAEALAAEALLLRSEDEMEELVASTMQRRFPLELGAGA